MKIYLSGPITDTVNYERAFYSAEATLAIDRHEVINPVRLDKGDYNKPWGVYLGRDLEILRSHGIEAIVVLPGWEQSDGARIEVAYGRIQGIPILDTDLNPVDEQPEGPIKRAAPLVHGDRQHAYGHPSEDFARTAGMWRAMFGWEVRPEHVPLAMICVKLSRLQQSPLHKDSATDIAGYIETYEMTVDNEL